VLAAYLVLYPRARILIFVFLFLIEIPAVVVLCFWIVVQLFNGVATIGASPSTMGGVAWWAHIGGFIIGLLVALKAKRNDIRSAGYF
jgi:membrane associated rhomboid family serine protease